MKIFDIELDFDFTDADDMEKIEKQYPITQEKLGKIDKTKAFSEQIRESCSILNEFFDKVFGDGTSLKLFKGKNSFKKEITAFKQIMDARVSQDKELDEEIKMINDYTSRNE